VRGIKSGLISILAIGLLAGSTAGVAAQDEAADHMAPAVVTGTIFSKSDDADGTASAADGATLLEGVASTNKWNASDRRLSGTSTYTGNWLQYPAAGFQVEAATRVLENDDGRWVGTATAFADVNRNVGPPVNTNTVILHGEGAYEGLTAYVLTDYSERPATFVAAIFPGEMPPFPELPAE